MARTYDYMDPNVKPPGGVEYAPKYGWLDEEGAQLDGSKSMIDPEAIEFDRGNYHKLAKDVNTGRVLNKAEVAAGKDVTESTRKLAATNEAMRKQSRIADKEISLNPESAFNGPEFVQNMKGVDKDTFAYNFNMLNGEEQAAVMEATRGTEFDIMDLKTGMWDSIGADQKLDKKEQAEESGIEYIKPKDKPSGTVDTSITSGQVDAAGKLATIAASAGGEDSGQVVGSIATGASAGFALGGPYGAAAGAVLGAFAGIMGARASREEKEAAQREKLRLEAEVKKEKEKDRRLRLLESKQRADTQNYQILQQAISAALSKDTRMQIRT